MQTLELKGYWHRNWIFLLLILIVAFVLSRLSFGIPHILFFTIFAILFLYKLAEHDKQVKLDYAAYGSALYKAEKITNDIINSIITLQTIGLTILIRNMIIEKTSKSFLDEHEWIAHQLWKKLNEFSITFLAEKVIVIIKEAEDICAANKVDSNEYERLLLGLEDLRKMMQHGYQNTNSDFIVDTSLIIERLILDNRKIAVTDYGEPYHCVQSVINQFMLHKHRSVSDVGNVLEELKSQIKSIIDGEVIDSKTRVIKYLKITERRKKT